MAQSAVDAYNLSQSELRGTARFMSMGGAFTALGGDLSAVSLNPAIVRRVSQQRNRRNA